jgi:hypothetical protein
MAQPNKERRTKNDGQWSWTSEMTGDGILTSASGIRMYRNLNFRFWPAFTDSILWAPAGPLVHDIDLRDLRLLEEGERDRGPLDFFSVLWSNLRRPYFFSPSGPSHCRLSLGPTSKRLPFGKQFDMPISWLSFVTV